MTAGDAISGYKIDTSNCNFGIFFSFSAQLCHSGVKHLYMHCHIAKAFVISIQSVRRKIERYCNAYLLINLTEVKHRDPVPTLPRRCFVTTSKSETGECVGIALLSCRVISRVARARASILRQAIEICRNSFSRQT